MHKFRLFSLLLPASLGIALTLLLFGESSLQGTAHDRHTPADSPTGHSGQTVTLLPDGRWLFVGGEGPTGPLATATLWNPYTQTVTLVTQTLPHPRAWHSATVLPDGTVLLVGGVGANGQIVEAAEVFERTPRCLSPCPART